jgi:anti-sigma factor RsiW
MDHRTLEERQIPERYLLGRLSPEEAELFEQHLLYCPRCQERVETTGEMVDGLRTVAGEDAATASRLGVLAWLARRGRAVRWSLAAALLLAFLVPGLILQRRIDDLRSALAEARGPRPATLLSLAAQRGTDAEPSHQLRVGEGTGWVVLSLQLDELTAERHRRYAVTLTGPRGRELWSVRDLAPDPRDTLSLTLPASTLVPGVHQLRVEALPADTTGEPIAVGSYAFRAVD